MAYLELSGLSKRFLRGGRSFPALAGVSLSFARNEFTVILGPSGCGKSTLLAIIAGITAPDTGRVLLEGVDITDRPVEKRNFGLVFQNYALFPNLEVGENIAYGLRARGWSRRELEARLEEMLALTHLQDYARRLPQELSGGQQQRVALARALAPRQALLLLDEPLSALDAQVRGTLGLELARIQRETSLTTIMVTHDQEEALSLADRVVLMRAGQVEQQGGPEELYERPVGLFAASFLGRMNFINLPGEGRVGIRYEDVRVSPATELSLAEPEARVGKVLRSTLLGAAFRLEILLNDFSTRLFADLPRTERGEHTAPGRLVAVRFPREARLRFPEDTVE